MSDEKQISEFPLPDFLQLSPERLAENAAYQEIWRKRAAGRDGFGDEFTRAVLVEEDAWNVLENLKSQRMTENGHAAFRREMSRLADAIAAQGRFDEAAHIEPKKSKSAEYQKIWEAVWREDDQTCPCPSYRNVNNKKLLNDVHLRDVFSLKHSTMMALIGCNGCGFYNVRPLTFDLVQQRQKQQWLKS